MEGALPDAAIVLDPNLFIDRIVEIKGTHFERLHPITDYRRDPGEGRILFHCRRIGKDSDSENDLDVGGDLVMKVKIQYATFEPMLLPSLLTLLESLRGLHQMIPRSL